MSDTPETDANLYGWAVEAELSRKLERERDEARRLATEYRDAYAKHFKDGYSDIASLPWELNDQSSLAMSLPKICTCPTSPDPSCPFHGDKAGGSLATTPCSRSDSATPETDRYNGTHETHRIGGLTIYGHAREMENQRNLWSLKHALVEQDIRMIRKIVTKGGTAQDVLMFLDTPPA